LDQREDRNACAPRYYSEKGLRSRGRHWVVPATRGAREQTPRVGSRARHSELITPGRRASRGRAPTRRNTQLAALKRSATFAQSTVFHHASR
jgi:hypothetical protein